MVVRQLFMVYECSYNTKYSYGKLSKFYFQVLLCYSGFLISIPK